MQFFPWGLQLAQTTPPDPHAGLVVPALHTPTLQQTVRAGRRPAGRHTQPADASLAHGARRARAALAGPRRRAGVGADRVAGRARLAVGVAGRERRGGAGGAFAATRGTTGGVADARPAAQAWPVEQEALAPHRQAPPVQLSARLARHGAQALPLAPQAVNEGAVQAVPAQQPPGHEVGSQTHEPERQRWPATHGAFEPHWQAPPTHWSALVASQTTQPPPLAPQAAVDGAWQVVPEQHPPGQELASQMQVPAEQA